MKQAIITFAEECCSTNIQLKTKKLQLSNDTLTRLMECISKNQYDQLLQNLKNFVYYSLALDTSKDFTDTEHLAVFIRGVMTDFKIYEEYLTLRSIQRTTKGTDLFREFQAAIAEANLGPSKTVSVATDGFPSKLGANQGLQGLINKWRKDNLAPVTWHHCILHQENLVAKSSNMSNVTDVVTTTAKWIQINALNHCKFKTFLLMPTMVMWSCLLRYDG